MAKEDSKDSKQCVKPVVIKEEWGEKDYIAEFVQSSKPVFGKTVTVMKLPDATRIYLDTTPFEGEMTLDLVTTTNGDQVRNNSKLKDGGRGLLVTDPKLAQEIRDAAEAVMKCGDFTKANKLVNDMAKPAGGPGTSR